MYDSECLWHPPHWGHWSGTLLLARRCNYYVQLRDAGREYHETKHFHTLKRRSLAKVSQGNDRDIRQHRRGKGALGSSLWLATVMACFAAVAAMRIMELNPVLPPGLEGDGGRPWWSPASFWTAGYKTMCHAWGRKIKLQLQIYTPKLVPITQVLKWLKLH